MATDSALTGPISSDKRPSDDTGFTTLPGGGLMGHLPAIRRDVLGLFMRAMTEAGDRVRVRLGPVNAYFLFNPDDIERVLVTEAHKATKTTRGYRKLRLVMGQGLVTSDGDFWLRQRRIAQPAFARKSLTGFADTMAEAAEELVEAWAAPAAAGQTVDVATAMHRVTLKIAGLTLFSADLTAEAKVVGDALNAVLDRFKGLVTSAMPWPEYLPTPANFRFWRAKRTLDTTVRRIIAERRASGDPGTDLLGMLMATRDADTGETMSDEQLRDEAVTMLMAGHETTANALAWMLYLLSGHPEIARKVEAEVDTVLGDRRPGLGDYKALAYTLQVVREAMRVYPPVWAVARMANEDIDLGDGVIPKGGYIMLAQYAVHRNPRLWDNPEAFDPDRFGPDQPAPGRYAYFPFSRGKRQCIGDRFAEIEAVILLATFVRRYRFALEPGHPIVMDPSVTLRPRYGLPMKLTPR